MRNVGQTPHISLTASPSLLIGPSVCSINCTHALIGCPVGEDKQEVKELRALFAFTPGHDLWGLRLCEAGFGMCVFVSSSLV